MCVLTGVFAFYFHHHLRSLNENFKSFCHCILNIFAVYVWAYNVRLCPFYVNECLHVCVCVRDTFVSSEVGSKFDDFQH